MVQRITYPTPPGLTDTIIDEIVDSKIEYFKDVYSVSDILNHQNTVFATIINSLNIDGYTLPQQIGTVNAERVMKTITFAITTGHKHT